MPEPRSRPEIQLLLACARPADDGVARRRIADLCAGGLDWNAVIAAALRHGVLPLVIDRVGTLCAATVPASTREALHAHARSMAGNNLLLAGQMIGALDTLARAGIEALPLKGPALAQRIHGDVLHREFYDVDILVRRADVRAACRLLTGNGYRQDDEHPPISDGPLPDDLHVEMRRTGLSFMLELHWALSTSEDALPVEFDRLWSRRQPVQCLDRSVDALDPADELVFLCIHGARHAWGQLKHVCDVAGIVRAANGLDWDAALRTAQEWGAERALLLGLALAKRLAEIDMPAEMLHRTDAVSRIASGVERRMFEPPPPEPMRLAELHLLRMSLRDRTVDRFRYLLRLLRPHETDRILMPLPAHLRAVHFVARPIRLLVGLLRSRTRKSADSR
ncbi:MAG TPA: nucleotidyltransferase family protein [Armatimonadota bacterium]|jgi:hypothetical protein